jgi:hypothetical protein
MKASDPHSTPADAGASVHGGADQEVWEPLLRSAIRAPSGHNTQPWRFQISDDGLRMYADRSRALPVVDPDDRAMVISCGAALAHLVGALRHSGYSGGVSHFPDPADPDLLAVVALGQPCTPGPDDHALFEAMDGRHTHRADFDDRPVPAEILTQLGEDVRRTGANLRVFTDDESRAAIATLVGEGDRAQFSDPGFRHELAGWIRPNRTRRSDGMPGYAFGISDLASLLGPTMVATFDTGARQARKDGHLALAAPALMVLSTAGDTPPEWLVAGQALAVLLLRATTHGLAASFLNQPIEVPALRARLRDLIGGGVPQLMLRVGYGAPGRPTPRRSVADVLTPPPTSTGTSS